MYNLNLIDYKKSDLKYKISKFPDGQQTINLEVGLGIGSDYVELTSRLNNFGDLELIICATQALRNIGFKYITLYIPFFLGSRSDRLFQTGGVNYLKQVIAPIVNLQGYDKVTTIDPHSDVLEAVLNNFDKINNFKLVKYALTNIDNKDGARDRICLISPDAGAYKKIFDIAKEFKIENIVTANKVRDLTSGKILRTEIPNLDFNDNTSYVIIDDICDGGRTFIELSKVIKEQKPNSKIYLIVTHGIFSGGLDILKESFDGIFTTNSYMSIWLEENNSNEKIYQLDVSSLPF
jgi:ribose-phosphate pyrophosphokinase